MTRSGDGNFSVGLRSQARGPIKQLGDALMDKYGRFVVVSILLLKWRFKPTVLYRANII